MACAIFKKESEGRIMIPVCLWKYTFVIVEVSCFVLAFSRTTTISLTEEYQNPFLT